MRRQYCLSSQRASCLVGAWVEAHTGVSLRSVSSAPASAAPTTNASSPSTAAPAASNHATEAAAASNTNQHPSTPSGEQKIEVAGKDQSDALRHSTSATTTTATAATAHTPPKAASPVSGVAAAPAGNADSVAAATERLRAALRVLSVIEQAKSDEQKLKLSHLKEEVTPVDVEPDSEDVAFAEEVARAGSPSAANPPGSTTTSPTATINTSAPSGSVSSSDAGNLNKSGSNSTSSSSATSNAAVGRSSSSAASTKASGAPALSWASATSSWIRNKRPKFWAIVNEAGNDEDEAGSGGATTADTRAESNTKESNDRTATPAGLKKANAESANLKSRATTTTPASQSTKVEGRSSAAPETLTSPAKPTSGEGTSAKGANRGVRTTADAAETVSADPTAFTPADNAAPAFSTTSSENSFASSAVPSVQATPAPSVPPAPSTTPTDATPRGGSGGHVSAHSIRAAGSVPPFRSRYKKDVAHALSALLNSDPTLGPQLLGQLSAESRRLMLIMGTASEYFGVDYGEVAEQIKEADTDRDNSISSKEFDAWVGQMAEVASTRRHDRPSTSTAPSPPSTTSTTLVGSTLPFAPNASTGGTDGVTDVPLVSLATAATPASVRASQASTSASKAAPAEVLPSSPTTAAAAAAKTVSAPLSFSTSPPASASATTKPTATANTSSAATAAAPPSESDSFMTTITSGPTAHVIAPSATLSRQRAEMAISTARAASARIIEVMQKNVASLSADADATSSTTAATSAGAARDERTPKAASKALSEPTQQQGQSVPASAASTVTSTAVPQAVSATSAAGAITTQSPSAQCAEVPAAPSTAAADATQKAKKGDPGYIPWPTFLRIVLAAAPPFLAFGMLDNCTLVLAGGAIDNVLSAKLGLTQMAAASMGGVVSGVAGIQVHGLAERFTRAKPPQLTAEQQRSNTYLRAENVGNTLGMVVGLVLGMTPLLFMRRSPQTEEEEAAEHKRFHEEAARSHQRQCKRVEKMEGQARQALMKEEQAARAAMAKLISEKRSA